MSDGLKRSSGAAAAVCLCVVLAACNTVGEPPIGSLEQGYGSQGQMTALSSLPTKASAPARAIVVLPDAAGSAEATRQHDFIDGFRQDIVLKGGPTKAGRDSVVVIARTLSRTTLDEATPLYKPTEDAIRSELGRQFPHVAMKVVERPSSNTYGPYGLALGRGEGTVHCAYMWQWIDENRLPPDAGVLGPVSLRVRLCKADTTFDEMASWFDRLAIRKPVEIMASSDAVPALDAPPVDPEKPVVRKHKSRKASHRRRGDGSPGGAAVATPSLASPIAGGDAAPPMPLATDLPPQALLGPRATSTNATRRN